MNSNNMELGTKQVDFFSFEDKITGLEYLLISIIRYFFIFVATFVGIFFITMVDSILGAEEVLLGLFGGMFLILMAIVSVVSAVAVTSQRLNDMGIDRLWSILLFFPGVNILLALILLISPSKK